MQFARRRVWFLPLLLASIIACESQTAKMAPQRVTVQLKWVHQAQFAGMYVAVEKGYYAEENIQVDFLEGGQGIDIAASVVAGKAQFGVISPEDILIGRSRGDPLKAIAAIYRRNAVVFLARADSGITHPRDFIHKTVASGGTGGAIRDFQFQLNVLVKKLELDISKITIVPYDSQYGDFINGTVDVTPAFSTGGLISLRKKGMKLNLIWPSDYGIHLYSDTLVTTDSIIQKDPDLVTRFLRATLRGWRDAVGNAGDSAATVLKYAQVKDPDTQMRMMEALLPLVHTGEDHIGWMTAEEWQGMYTILLNENIIETPFDLNTAYTMEFLQNVYRGEGK